MTLTIAYTSEGIRVQATIRDYADFDGAQGALLNVTSHSIQLYHPDGTTQGAAETGPVNSSTGKYYQDFALPDTITESMVGMWRVRWTATRTDGKKGVEDAYFEVRK